MAILIGIVVVTAVAAIGIAIGAVIAGGDIVPAGRRDRSCSALYAAALAGIGVAIGGVFGSGLRGPGRGAPHDPDLVPRHPRPGVQAARTPSTHLALTSHYGFTMLGQWDPVGIVASVVLAVGGVALGAWGFRRRDLRG